MASLLELDRETIDAISLTRFGWAIGKHVAQVTAALLAEHLGTDHAVTGIPRFLHHTFSGRPIKARPATTGIELGVRLKQQLTTAAAVVGALLPNIPVFAGEGALGALLTEHIKLLGGQLLPPRGFIFVLPGHHHSLIWTLLPNPIALRQRGGHHRSQVL